MGAKVCVHVCKVDVAVGCGKTSGIINGMSRVCGLDIMVCGQGIGAKLQATAY